VVVEVAIAAARADSENHAHSGRRLLYRRRLRRAEPEGLWEQVGYTAEAHLKVASSARQDHDNGVAPEKTLAPD
jgi:hypothetical protein